MLKIESKSKPRNLVKIIKKIPKEAQGVVTFAAGEYLVGNDRRGLRHYLTPKPPQSKYVRTGTLKRNWMAKQDGDKTILSNKTAYAGFVQGLKQAWMHIRNGWRTWARVAKDNTKGMLRSAELAVNRLLKKEKLK
jgi:hypothetical protein